MSNGSSSIFLRWVAVVSYILSILIWVPTPESGSVHLDNNKESVLELFIEDVLGIENELANWSLSGYEENLLDILEIQYEIDLSDKGAYQIKGIYPKCNTKSVVPSLETYKNPHLEQNTPPPQLG